MEWIEEIELFKTKVCSKCKEDKPVDAFYWILKRVCHHSICKTCERKRAKEWTARNLERHRDKCKKWRDKNPEYNKEWKSKNPDKVKKIQEKYTKKRKDSKLK